MNIDELVEAALKINYAQGFDLNVDMRAPHTVKLSDAKVMHHFLVDNSLHFGVNEIISFQKPTGNSDKVTVANLRRQHHKSSNSYFKSF